MTRYTKKVREEAAPICAIAASSSETTLYYVVSRSLGTSKASYRLACAAYRATPWIGLADSDDNASCLRDAYAESLLRTGWSP